MALTIFWDLIVAVAVGSSVMVRLAVTERHNNPLKP